MSENETDHDFLHVPRHKEKKTNRRVSTSGKESQTDRHDPLLTPNFKAPSCCLCGDLFFFACSHNRKYQKEDYFDTCGENARHIWFQKMNKDARWQCDPH